ncbi:sulfotransferase, partial [bacterium]|nr:sulfotransferase [bacterium]
MKKFINDPIFLCGHRKAGTTMLLCLLDSHPELLVYPADSGFFYAYYPRAEEKKYSNKNKIDTVINFCIKNLDLEIKNLSPKDKRNLTFSIDNFIKDFHKTLNKSDMSSKKILKAMIEAFAINTNQDINGIKYWVEKTTSTEIYATEIIKWFPRAKFIHLIRDPRDNWASLKSGWLKRYRHFNDSYLFLLQSMFERSKLGMEMAEHNKK